MMRPTVPEAAEALRAYYRLPDRGNGGAVHIITEDGNCEQKHADWCANEAHDWHLRTLGQSDDYADEDVRIARMLAAMTRTQRRKLYAAHSFYPWLETSGASDG